MTKFLFNGWLWMVCLMTCASGLFGQIHQAYQITDLEMNQYVKVLQLQQPFQAAFESQIIDLISKDQYKSLDIARIIALEDLGEAKSQKLAPGQEKALEELSKSLSELRNSFEEQKLAAVEKAGMTRARYLEISAIAAKDHRLMYTFHERLIELNASSNH
jgi:hypothetical protein